MVSTTDALAKTTTYGYNEDTNVLDWVKYPNDTESTRTEYTYDSMYRLATATADVSTGYTLTASYTYEDDLLTRIQTGSTIYSFTYGDFSSSITHAEKLKNSFSRKNYKLLRNNCMQVSVDVLMQGKFAQSDACYTAF